MTWSWYGKELGLYLDCAMQLPHDFKWGGCIVTLTFYKVHFAQNTEHRLHGGKFRAKGAIWEVSLWNKRSTVPFQTGDCRRWEKQKREWPRWEYWEVESTSLWVGQTCYVKALARIVAEMGRLQVLIQGSLNRCWDHRRGREETRATQLAAGNEKPHWDVDKNLAAILSVAILPPVTC